MAEYTLTDCAEHGSTVVPDTHTLFSLLPVVLECTEDSEASGHIAWHLAEDTSCWACCDQMTIAPTVSFERN